MYLLHDSPYFGGGVSVLTARRGCSEGFVLKVTKGVVLVWPAGFPTCVLSCSHSPRGGAGPSAGDLASPVFSGVKQKPLQAGSRACGVDL